MAVEYQLLALIFSLSGSFCTALGLINLKLANYRVEKDRRRVFICTREFWLGVFFLISSQTCNGVALHFGTIMLISATAPSTIIFNAILSPLILGEKFSCKHDGLTMLLLVSGCTFAVIQNKDVETENYEKDDVVARSVQKVLRAPALTYYSGLVAVVLLRFWLKRKVRRELDQFYERTLRK